MCFTCWFFEFYWCSLFLLGIVCYVHLIVWNFPSLLTLFYIPTLHFFTHLQLLHNPPSENPGHTHPHLTCTLCGHTKATTPCWSICGDGWRRYYGGSLISNWYIWCWTYSLTWMIHELGLFLDHQFVVLNILYHARTQSVFGPTWWSLFFIFVCLFLELLKRLPHSSY